MNSLLKAYAVTKGISDSEALERIVRRFFKDVIKQRKDAKDVQPG